MAVLVLSLSTLTSVARAEDTRVSVTSTSTVEAHLDNNNESADDDGYLIGIERLNASANAGAVSATARVDAWYFPELSDDLEPPSADFRNRAQLERLTVAVGRGDFKFTLGDFYRQQGRGIVLAMRKIDEVGLDVSIRGGLIEFEGDNHAASVFAGFSNPANLDSISQKDVRQKNDTIAGAHYELRALDVGNLSIFGTYLQPQDQFRKSNPDLAEEADIGREFTASSGVSIDLQNLAPFMALYVEGDVQHRMSIGEPFLGYASYAAADLFLGDVTVLMEGLYSHDFQQLGSENTALGNAFRYNSTPTLERIDQETSNNPSILGGRLRVEKFFAKPNLTIHANGVTLINNYNEVTEFRQLHGYGGFVWYFQSGKSRLGASGGYRDETSTNLSVDFPDTNGRLILPHRQFKSLIHGELDYVQSLGARNSMHVSSTNEFKTLEDDSFARGTTLVGVDRGGLGGVTLELGYDTSYSPSYFVAGIVKWEATTGITVSATGGTQRGGLKCINGVCRQYPAFAGAKLDVVARF